MQISSRTKQALRSAAAAAAAGALALAALMGLELALAPSGAALPGAGGFPGGGVPAFGLGGAALLLLSLGARRTGRVALFMLLLLALHRLLVGALLPQFSASAGAWLSVMPLPAAAVLLLFGLSLVLLRWPLVSALLAAATAGAGLSAMLAELLIQGDLGRFGGGAGGLVLAVGFVLLGSGAFSLAAALGWHRRDRAGRWVLLPVGVLGAVVVVSLWRALVALEHEALEQRVEREAAAIVESFSTLVGTHVNALVRMARRWEQDGGTSRRDWVQDARLYVRHEPAYQAINWVGPDLVVRWVVPVEGNEAAVGLDAGADPVRRAALLRAERTGRVSVSAPLELVQGGKGFLVVLPLQVDGRPDGFILGVFRYAPLIEQVQEELRRAGAPGEVGFALYSGDEVLLRYPAAGAQPPASIVAQRRVHIGGQSIGIRAWPLPALTEEVHTPLPGAVLGAGLSLTVLLLLALYLALLAGARARDLARARDELDARVQARTAELQASNQRLLDSQAALSESEARLAAALRGGHVGTWSLQQQPPVVVLDATAAALLGLGATAAELAPAQLITRVAEDDRAAVEAVLRSAGAGAEAYREFRVPLGSGGERFLALRGEQVQGAPASLVGVIWDISERRRHEEALRHYADELKRSNEELEQFAYIASHDLQEPLRAMAAYADLLERRYAASLDEQGRVFTGHIRSAAARMQRLLSDVLDYSRAGGRSDHPRQWLDTGQLVEEIAEGLLAARPAEQRGAVVRGELPRVMAHETPLRQVFQNLISNGLKFAGDAPPRVEVSAVRGADEWVFCVRDNGIGIPPEHQERVFRIFHRLHDPQAYPGTGLGLALVKKIVEHYGGRVWLESAPGEGTAFFFSLPDVLDQPL